MGGAAPTSSLDRASTVNALGDHHVLKAHDAEPSPVYSRDFAYANNEPVTLAHNHLMGSVQNHPEKSSGLHSSSVDKTSAKTFAELLSGPTVEFFVGPGRHPWSLHLNLLCHHSSWFEAEYCGHEVPRHLSKSNDNGADGETQSEQRHKLELPDDEPQGFELFVKWLYQGHLEEPTSETGPVGDDAHYKHAVACHKLHLLASRFAMSQLANLAMDSYRRSLYAAKLVPDATEIDDIYRTAPPESPFRPLMVHIAARQIMDPEAEKDLSGYRGCFKDNPGFALELVKAMRKLSGGVLLHDPTAEPGCKYHDHSDGSGCTAKGRVERVKSMDSPMRSRPRQLIPGSNSVEPQAVKAVTPSAKTAQKPPESPTLTNGLPVELSAERRTPRKLKVKDTSSSPRGAKNSNVTESKPLAEAPPRFAVEQDTKAKPLLPSAQSPGNGRQSASNGTTPRRRVPAAIQDSTNSNSASRSASGAAPTTRSILRNAASHPNGHANGTRSPVRNAMNRGKPRGPTSSSASIAGSESHRSTNSSRLLAEPAWKHGPANGMKPTIHAKRRLEEWRDLEARSHE